MSDSSGVSGNPGKSLMRYRVRTAAPTLVVDAEAVRIGADLLVYIWGGNVPHIGAVAAAQPRPSLADSQQNSATASVLTYLGHKEDEVVKYVSEKLSGALNTKVVVTAGIHWDDLTTPAIDTIIERCREITETLIVQMQSNEESRA